MKKLLLFFIGIAIHFASFSQAEVKQQGDTVKIVKRGGGNAYLDVVGILRTPTPPSGSATDSIVTWDPATKQFKKISRTSLLTHTHPIFQIVGLPDSLINIQSRIQSKLTKSDADTYYPSISRTLDSLAALRSANAAKLNITDAASTYPTITRFNDTANAIQNRIQTKEPLIAAGTTGQYWRGDKSWQTLDKTAVGLGNVDNTSDANKPISTATQTALDGKVPTSRTINGYALTSNITLTKSDVGLSNVPNTDATNATNITSGTLPDARLSANVTVQGNSFNSANQLVKLDAGGKLPTSTIPSLALVETFVVGSQAAMLALTAQMGDVAVRTDNNRSYILQSEPATTLSNWVQLLVPDSETDPVYTASSWFSTTNNASNWNTAYSWGNHASAGYATASRTITINGTTYDLTVNRSWTVGDVRTDGSYSNPAWITALAWSKLTGVPSTFTPSSHTHPYSDLTGTVPTWNQNTTGNAATATNSTQWNGYTLDLSTSYGTGFDFLIGRKTGDTQARLLTAGGVQTWLGLGSNAYTSTQFLPLTGGIVNGVTTIKNTVQNISLILQNKADNSFLPTIGFANGDLSGFYAYIQANKNGATSLDLYANGLNFYNINTSSLLFSVSNSGVAQATSFSGEGTGLTGLATGLTAQRSRELVSLGSYVWTASSLPSAYNDAITMSFVQPTDGWPGYGTVVTAKTYPVGGGTLQTYVPYSPSNGGTGLQVRFGNYDVSGGNSWTSWKTLLASDNYNSYAPTLTGTGASGTWGINITGNAATVTNGVYTNTTQTISGEKTFSSTYTYVNTLRASGDVIAYYTSDRRLKKNIKPIENALEKLSRLSGNEYDWDEAIQNTYKGHDYGVIAQEIESVLPGTTHQKPDGFFGIKNQNQIMALLIQAVKELKNEVDQLKKR